MSGSGVPATTAQRPVARLARPVVGVCQFAQNVYNV